MRLFIAVELSELIKAALVLVQERLRRMHPLVTWVAPHTMHLTLQFLGEVDAARIPQVTAAMDDAAAQLRGLACVLQLDGFGVFPNELHPTVVWVGVGGATAALAQVQTTLATRLAPLDLARAAYPFRAHLTLGRVRREATLDQQKRLGEALRTLSPPPPLTWTVTQVVLYQSELQAARPLYTPRYSVAFGV